MSAAATEGPASGEAREERHRLAVLVASGPLVLLLGPVVLPMFGDRSFLASTRGQLAPLAILFGVFFWPLFVGVLGLRRTLVRRAPGTAAFAVPAVVHLLAAIGGALLLLVVLEGRQQARASPGVWISLGMALAMAYVIARGFRREGWERWAQIVAGLWLGYAAFTLLVAGEARDMVDPPSSGGWVLLFALSAAAPAVGWILWPKGRGNRTPS